jgi:hypothetical protein
VYVRHEVIRTCPHDQRTQPAAAPRGDPFALLVEHVATGQTTRTDPFAELVREVAADLANPFHIERFLWVLEEPPVRTCGYCGALFNPWADYAGAPARGRPRRYCSPRCANRIAYYRQRIRATADRRRSAA